MAWFVDFAAITITIIIITTIINITITIFNIMVLGTIENTSIILENHGQASTFDVPGCANAKTLQKG